jgi:plasmid stabilization system protein ParE
VAVRFHDALTSDITGLLELPEKGHLAGLRGRRLRSLRRWPVSGFELISIFYRPTDHGIEVARVLHGARDIARIFGRKR